MADLIISLWILIFPAAFIVSCIAGNLLGRYLRSRSVR